MTILYPLSRRRHWLHRPDGLRFLALLILLTTAMPSCSIYDRLKDATPPVHDLTDESSEEPDARVTAEDVMVNDLLSAIVQIMPPKQTTVQVRSSIRTDIYRLVADSFAQRGYGIQKVTTDQGPMLVSSDLVSDVPDTGNTTSRLRVGIGAISISRSYEYLGDDAVQPTSPFRIYGSRASIDVSSTLFGASQATESPTAETEYAAPISLDEPLPVLSLITPEIVQRVVEDTTGVPEATSLNSSKVEVNNLFYSDSTFGSILDNYDQVDRLVVIFPDDSIVLGDENKLLIRRFTERFVESDDVISLVGCSNGPTASELGNVGLALGRAERVTDELLEQGIPREKILDEGCWAPQGNVKDFPGRGVVMSIHRTQS